MFFYKFFFIVNIYNIFAAFVLKREFRNPKDCLVFYPFPVWSLHHAYLQIQHFSSFNILFAGVESFLIFSMDTSIRGTSLDQSGEGDLLIPITGLLLSVAIDFDAG